MAGAASPSMQALLSTDKTGQLSPRCGPRNRVYSEPALRFQRPVPTGSFYALVETIRRGRPRCLSCFDRERGFKSMVFFTITLQLLVIMVMGICEGQVVWNKHQALNKSTVAVIGIIQGVQVIVLLLALAGMLEALWDTTLTQAWTMYTCICVAFGGFYTLIYLSQKSAFSDMALDDDKHYKPKSPAIDVFATFFYYSIETQTLVGYGDILPVSVLAQYVTVLQSCLALMFHMFIISQTLSRFASPDPIHLVPSSRLGRLFYVISHNKCLKVLRRQARSKLLVVGLMVSVATYSIVYMSSPNVFAVNPDELHAVHALLAIQLLFSLVVIVTATKFVRHASEVSWNFLLQAWFSLVLVYGGLYFCMYLMSPQTFRSFHIPFEDLNDSTPRVKFWYLLAEMIYFSFCTMTTLGFGDIFPRIWYSRVLCCVQMLVSTFFHVVVLGLGLQRISARLEVQARSPPQSYQRRSTETSALLSDEDMEELQL